MKLRQLLDDLYNYYNKKEFISPDPLQFLHNYRENFDIEIVGLIASSLAYGRVNTILKNVKHILDTIGSPYNYILTAPDKRIKDDFKEFKHRFTTGDEIGSFLVTIKRIFQEYDSVFNFFLECYKNNDEDLLKALEQFTTKFRHCNSLIPNVSKGSACKRLFLFLRWMIRKDNVDLGIWHQIDCSKLIIPLDTHMLKISKMLKFTDKKSNSLKTAMEITENFRKINKIDPVKYDFSLTRFGIRNELTLDNLIEMI